MSQLERPLTIFYGDGTWEILNLNPNRIRGDIRKNYPLGNPMHGFTLAIEKDYFARKQNLETALQIELNTSETRQPPPTNNTPDASLSRTINAVNELISQKNSLLQQELKIIKTSKQHGKLQATYNAMILKDQIDILHLRQNHLHKEKGRREAELSAQQQAAEAARTAAQAQRQAEEQARLAIEEESSLADEYKRNISFLADMNESILKKYGENMGHVAHNLQKDISGKKVRSYRTAMKTFEKVRKNPNVRLSPQDTQAVIDALNALDKATLADNANRLAKAFGLVGEAVQAHSIVENAAIGFKDGNWAPLMLELESIAAGAGASALLATVLMPILTMAVPSTAALIITAILMASASAYLDAKQVDIINKRILNKLNSLKNEN
jgi:hypothetical protein